MATTDMDDQAWERQHKLALNLAFDKIDNKLRRLAPTTPDDVTVLLKITKANLKALQLFGRKFNDD